MALIPDQSIDMILCDLPYSMTNLSWDTIIPLDQLWQQYNRIIKDCGVIVLTGSQPFTSLLGASQLKKLKYSLIWEKSNGSNFLNVKKQPFKVHEDVLIFYDGKAEASGKTTKLQPLRDYLQTEKQKTGLTTKEINTLLGNQMSSHYFTKGIQFGLPSAKDYKKLQSTGYFQRPLTELKAEWKKLTNCLKPTYNPQKAKGRPYRSTRADKTGSWGLTHLQPNYTIINDGDRHPRSVLQFKTETGLHPTQKPVALFEWLIRTYSNEGETVLDNCMGSGTTAIATINTNRHFIGFEIEEEFFKIANERITKHTKKGIDLKLRR